jgi:YD repeat-containing protein
VFLVSSLTTAPKQWMIYYLESLNGILAYRNDDPLAESSKIILMAQDCVVLPFAADNDSKTSLLFASKSLNDKLQFQLLRSTGISFIADTNPSATEVAYEGNLTISKATSPNSLSVINIVDSPKGPQLHVFRFDSEKFTEITGVTQPQKVPQGSLVRWADLRGLGRADCIINTFDNTGAITIQALNCSDMHPLDRILTCQNGLGTISKVKYSPLSDPNVYTSDDAPSSQVTALMNGLASNCSSAAILTGQSGSLQNMECTRSELIAYPTFVVSEVVTVVFPLNEEIISYKYQDGHIEFDGHGWLGFKSISKTSKPLGVIETTTYYQEFPLVGQVSKLEKKEIETEEIIQINEYSWSAQDSTDGLTKIIYLPKLQEAIYENNTPSYTIFVTFAYDSYGNILSTKICSNQQKDQNQLTIESTYNDPNDPASQARWIVGNKLSEVIKIDNVIMGQIQNDYVPLTLICKKTQKWITGLIWSTTLFQFDQAGNRTSTLGPNSYRQEYVYDSSYSFINSTTTYTNATKFLVEETIYDLASGLLLSTKKPSGLITAFKYDILGCVSEVNQDGKIIEKTSFSQPFREVIETQEISNGLPEPDHAFYKIVTYYDTLKRPVSVQKTLPDNFSQFSIVDTRYDGAGRIIACSQQYLQDQEPRFFKYKYDTRSRLVNKTYPSETSETSDPSVRHYFQYKFENNAPKTIETLIDAATAKVQQITKQYAVFPNAETPAADNFVKLCVVNRTNELNQSIQTTFDGLSRPTHIIDPSGVQLQITYDGLSRQVEKKILNGQSSKVLSHYSVTFQDNDNQSTLLNVLTGASTTTKTDFCQRIISKATQEETITFIYDEGDPSCQNQLVNVNSSKGITHGYSYDKYGNITKSSLKLDDQTYNTSYTWTSTKQLIKTTNPDGNSILHKYSAGGLSPQAIELLDISNNVKASLKFSEFHNAFGQPLHCVFGNGTNSKSSVASNGMLTQKQLINGSTQLLKQSWGYSSLNKITIYDIIQGSSESSVAYDYDSAGE